MQDQPILQNLILSPNYMLCLGGHPGFEFQARKTRHQIRTVNIWMHKALRLLLGVLFSVTHTIFAC